MRATAATARRRCLRRPVAGVAAALASVGLMAGCTGGSGSPAAAGGGTPLGAASPVAATAPAPAGAQDLTRGLLPADAFGPGATVVPVTLAQLQQRLAAVPGGLTTALAGVQITPPACAAALQGLGAGLVGTTDLAGEGARTGAGGTAEALVTSTSADNAVATLRTVVGSCGQARVTSPHGTATVSLAEVGMPALGDGAAAVRATAVLTRPDRAPVTVSGLLAVVRDGDRLLLLGTAAPGGTAPDVASFTTLLGAAYRTESDALG